MRLIDTDKLVPVTLTDGEYWTKEVYYKTDIDAAPTVSNSIDAAIKDLEMIGDCRTCGNMTPFCDRNPDSCHGYKWRGVPPDAADYHKPNDPLATEE